MKTNTSATKADNTNKTVRFDTLKIAENELIVQNKNEVEFSISFSDVDTVFIKRCHLGFFYKVGFIIISLLLIAPVANDIDIEIVPIIALCIAIGIWMNTYRWYQLHLLLHDGNLFYKTFYSDKKQEQMTLLNSINIEIYNNRSRSECKDGIGVHYN
jgi:hypothetical protein